MARVRVRHDTRLEYITSEWSWSCIRRQQIGVVEAKMVGDVSGALEVRENWVFK